MVNMIGLIVITFIVIGIGGGGFYLLYLKTRPKKETWMARIYQLGGGVRELEKDKEGNIISKIKLSELVPYARDTLEKIEKDPGITIYRLQKLNRVTPAVEGNVVEYWGEGKKEVSVLKSKDGYTLLRKGYDRETGDLIFNPLPHSRVNLIKSEMAIRKDRLHKEKDILMAITPWVIAGICMISLIGIAYITVEGYIKISENLESGMDKMANALEGVKDSQKGQSPSPSNLGEQPKPPLIE